MATSFMNLTLPGILTTKGPDYATMVNQALTTLDSHDHTAGRGTPVPTSGLNINADLPMANSSLNLAKSVRFQAQLAALVTPLDATSIYSKSGDLYYNNASNVPIQVTSGNSINLAVTGGITGDYSTSGASLNYTANTSTYSFFATAGTYANLAQGNTTITKTGAGNSATLTLVNDTQSIQLQSFQNGYRVFDVTSSRPVFEYYRNGTNSYLDIGSTGLPTVFGSASALVDSRFPAQVSTAGLGTQSSFLANSNGAAGVSFGYLTLFPFLQADPPTLAQPSSHGPPTACISLPRPERCPPLWVAFRATGTLRILFMPIRLMDLFRPRLLVAFPLQP